MQNDPANQNDRRLIPRRLFGQRLGVCPRTIARREHDDPEFPKPIKIKGRNYFWEHEVLEYERTLTRAAAAE
jgi:predicted DNA-binding transcriptional regulator AlpA